jgi:hypothetical protein
MSEIWQAWAAHIAPKPAVSRLEAISASLLPTAAIPPRAWLYGTRLIRGYVSVLAAPGGVGKSALALGQAACLATGRGLLGEHVHHSANAWVLNLEDPMDELDRRLAAFMQRHEVPRDALRERLFLHSGRTRRLCMAAHSEQGGIAHPDRDAVIAAAREKQIGLIVIDPFVKSHQLDENSNAEIDAAVTAWAEVASATQAAILLVHHVRKGLADGADATRGAKSLTDAARSVSLLSPMTQEEAQRHAVAESERWRHIRLDDAKANLAPRQTGQALWYRLESVALGNATPAYPNGDHVATLRPWKPHATPPSTPPRAGSRIAPIPLQGPPRPAPASIGASPRALNRVLDRIAAGPEPGTLYTATRGGRCERWAGQILVEELGVSEAEAAASIATWLRSGVLRERDYHDRSQRKQRRGLAVADANRPTTAIERHAP